MTPQALEEILPHLHALRSALYTAASEGVHEALESDAWSAFAEASEHIAELPGLNEMTAHIVALRGWLLEAAHQRFPLSSKQGPDDPTGVISTGARYYAARGLHQLVVRQKQTDAALLDEIEQLSKDSVRSIRAEVAYFLAHLSAVDAERAWRIARHLAQQEESATVLTRLLRSLQYLIRIDQDTGVDLMLNIFERAVTMPGSLRSSIIEWCAHVALVPWLNKEDRRVRPILDYIVGHLEESSDAVFQVIGSLREGLIEGPVEPTNPLQDRWRHLAFQLLMQFAESAISTLALLSDRHRVKKSRKAREELEGATRAVAGIVGKLGTEIYFASDAYDVEHKRKPSPGSSVKKRYLTEAKPLIVVLSKTGFAPVTHHIVQTLAFLADAAPEEVFLLLRQVIQDGTRGGYEQDSLAVKEIVNIVERYFAQYQHVFRGAPEYQEALIEVLDVFVRAGWPEARRLTYRFQEVFR